MVQREYFGKGSINSLNAILKQEQIQKVFLVVGKNSFKLSGANDYVEKSLSRYDLTFFDNFSPNPQLNQIKEGLDKFAEDKFGGIVAIGGGSAIDVAKAIKLFNYERTNNKIPLIAISTTAGSGSESTHFVVYYQGKEKKSKGKLDITLPNYVILDPELTMSLPEKIAASTGIDALGQAIESYWSINSTDQSKHFAKRAITLLMKNLHQAVKNPTLQNKTNVMDAANLAGKAINISKTTACHSIAYPLTSYFEIPHGHAVGLTLGEILIYNSKVNKDSCWDARGYTYVKKSIEEVIKIIGESTPEGARDKIKNLMTSLGLQTKLSELGINSSEREMILQKGFNIERMKNNPRSITKTNLTKILTAIQ